MKKHLIVLLGIFALSASSQAATSYTFNFAGLSNQQIAVGSTLNVYATLADGSQSSSIYVTLSAYSGTGLVGSDGSISGGLKTASVGVYNGYGLGICNNIATGGTTHGEGGVNCDSTGPHQIDDQYQSEFLLMTFSSNVDLNSVTLVQPSVSCTGCGGGGDMDMSYWTASTTLALGTGTTNISALGPTNTDTCSGSGCTTSGLVDSLGGTDSASSNGNNVKSLVISAGNVGGDANLDFFKINSLSAQSIVTTTPEPASFVMIGSGLLGAALLRRRKIAKANS